MGFGDPAITTSAACLTRAPVSGLTKHVECLLPSSTRLGYTSRYHNVSIRLQQRW